MLPADEAEESEASLLSWRTARILGLRAAMLLAVMLIFSRSLAVRVALLRFVHVTSCRTTASLVTKVVFAKLEPGAFSRAFGRWMAAACEGTGLVPVAIDGKSARRAKRNTATGCLTVVSAWATENRLTLGQVAVPDGSNEVGVIPELLRALDLSGAPSAALVWEGPKSYDTDSS